MANLKQLRLRIKSVKNTAKITRTMSMIAASKMRKAQQRATQGRLYKETLFDTLTTLIGSYEKPIKHPLFQTSNVEKSAVLLLTSDRGLCGSLNTNLLKMLIKDERLVLNNCEFYVVGKKGLSFLTRSALSVAETVLIEEDPTPETAFAVAQQLVDLFVGKKVGKVYIVYNQFVSTLKQIPQIEQLLPFVPMAGQSFSQEPILEPSQASVVDSLVTHTVEALVLQSLLDASASEHSSRMVAMQSATDNAKKLSEDLTLFANRARQDAITKELLDLAGAGE
jgi:F-type H+-transporting ATPase subunit gamma